ncbi:GPI-GlcNAc transferase complex PIG-H component [Quillaja saponaria]|uniref:GPI-GlcNAc transferase complex PIG-H component n=1 Tax=Quillaja saponaria TaxID=32244 RepID=A0AAD7KQS4_QUISA|nr:GPI-GlcNAc transferase complex PIG-H component [Quillaja saponaria]
MFLAAMASGAVSNKEGLRRNYWTSSILILMRMVNSSISNGRYTYLHDQNYPYEAIDMHHIIVSRSGAKSFFVYTIMLLVLACGVYLYLLKNLQPPVKILVPVWKGLCASTDSKEKLETCTVDN